MRGFWAIALIGCILAFLSFGADYAAAQSAPQQCVAISMALLIVIGAYCLSRCLVGMTSQTPEELKKINEALQEQNRTLRSMVLVMNEKEGAAEQS